MGSITEVPAAERTAVHIRKQLRTINSQDFIKAHTAAALADVAATLKITIPEEAKTKQDVYDAIVAGAKLPDQSLRGKSTIGSPVAAVWQMADKMVAAQKDDKRATRSQVVDECKAQGIAHHTARTQFQSWFVATDRGIKRLSDLSLEELPKALHPAEEVAA